ncbi:MAG: type II toxin-antitoxin system HicA family toxin [Desulfamplus sp.]|nr:type II toxin-antitoxin system HicA family toxin [Desulfamplus sp.]
MPKLPRLTADDAEKILFKAGFEYVRSKGSHRIYQNDNERFVLPFHKGKILHPKITKTLIELTDGNL